jgi:hypothetical protein
MGKNIWSIFGTLNLFINNLDISLIILRFHSFKVELMLAGEVYISVSTPVILGLDHTDFMLCNKLKNGCKQILAELSLHLTSFHA